MSRFTEKPTPAPGSNTGSFGQATAYELWVTKSDLNEFKQNLVTELKGLLEGQFPTATKQWYKTHEVKKMLNLSLGTIQHLRSSGRLRYTKIRGVVLYEYKDIQSMMDAGRK